MLRLSILSLALATAASLAQARPPRLADLGPICAVDIGRFCPALSPQSAGRDVRICLKPYHYSLARSCQHALAAVP